MTASNAVLIRGLAAILAVAALQPSTAAPPTALALAPAPLAAKDAGALATTLLDHLDAGRFDVAEALFSPALRQAAPAAKLQQVWTSLAQSVGPAGPRGVPVTSEQAGMTLVEVPLPYAKAQFVARISVDRQGRIHGFLVTPAPPSAALAPSPSAPYSERAMTVGEGQRALPGTLALPKRATSTSPVPAVVLVHGSGPHDRDETIGPNRPFLDIARGLASQGIAVLRYDKRTKARPQDLAGRDFDVDDEVTRDAVAAIEALRSVEGVDATRIFVLGHSLGGMLAPRIARQSGHVAGVILLAAPARPVLDLLLEQIHRQAARDGVVSELEQETLEDLRARVARVRGPGDVANADTPMELPAGYWRSLERIDPVADARTLSLPILVLHGGRDIQVVDADWQRWQARLTGQPNARLRHYPALNHLGIPGQGPGNVEEYLIAGQVEPRLIDEIGAWVRPR